MGIPPLRIMGTSLIARSKGKTAKEGYAGAGLQWLSAESKHRRMSHKSAVFLLQWSAALLSVRWALNGKVYGNYLLIQEGVLTIPIFHALNVRFSVKIFAKKFESSQKQAPISG